MATDCGPVPLAFLAATLNVYVVPFVSPVTVCEVAVELNVRAVCATVPTYGVTTYAVIADPLSRRRRPRHRPPTRSPAPPAAPVGAAGAPTVTAPDATDCGPVPLAFLAATLNVYVVPFVSPVIVCDVAVELNVRAGCTMNPMYGVTTYPVIAEPLFAGAVHDTTADPFPGTAVDARRRGRRAVRRETHERRATVSTATSVVVSTAWYCRYRPTRTVDLVPGDRRPRRPGGRVVGRTRVELDAGARGRRARPGRG